MNVATTSKNKKNLVLLFLIASTITMTGTATIVSETSDDSCVLSAIIMFVIAIGGLASCFGFSALVERLWRLSRAATVSSAAAAPAAAPAEQEVATALRLVAALGTAEVGAFSQDQLLQLLEVLPTPDELLGQRHGTGSPTTPRCSGPSAPGRRPRTG